MDAHIIHPFGPPDHEAVASELERFQRRRGRRDPQLPGCLLAFVGMMLLTLTPAVGNWLEIPQAAGTVLFALAVAALVGGAAVALAGGAFQGRRSRREQEAAVAPIRAYAESGGDREAALRAATRLLVWARWSADPGRQGPLLSEEMLSRLGPRGADLVRAVEEYLLYR